MEVHGYNPSIHEAKQRDLKLETSLAYLYSEFQAKPHCTAWPCLIMKKEKILEV